MSCPTIEDVTREVIRRLQAHFLALLGNDPAGKPSVDVYGATGGTAIEVVGDDGAPVIEVQDRPKVSVMGPALRRSQRFGADADRVVVSRNTGALTYVDAPAPMLRDLDYQLVVTTPRETQITLGNGRVVLGLSLLEQQILIFGNTGGAGGPFLKGSGWTGDGPTGRWLGYLFELTGEPQPIPNQAASLHAFGAQITVRDVRITDGSNATGQLTQTLNLTTGPLLDGQG